MDKVELGYYRTQGGQKVRVICTDAITINTDSESYPVIILRKNNCIGKEVVEFLTAQGKHEHYSDCNLVAPWKEPILVEGFLNVYPSGAVYFNSTRKGADSVAGKDRIACIPISVCDE